MIDQRLGLIIDLIAFSFDLLRPVELFVVNKKFFRQSAYFFNDLTGNHHASTVCIVRYFKVIVLAFVFFPAADHTVSSRKNVDGIISGIFNRALVKIVMEFRTYHSGIGMLFKYLEQAFNETGCEFGIVVYNKKII